MTALGRTVTATSATTRDVPLMASRCQWRCFAIAPGDGNDPAALTGDCPCMRAEANALVAIYPELLVRGVTATQVVMAAAQLLDLHPDDQPARVALAVAELRRLVSQPDPANPATGQTHQQASTDIKTQKKLLGLESGPEGGLKPAPKRPTVATARPTNRSAGRP